MGILDFIAGKKPKKTPEQTWKAYTSTYYKKYDLAIKLRDLTKSFAFTKGNAPQPLPDKVAEAVINIVTEIEKMIPAELVEISEEETELKDIQEEMKSIFSRENFEELEDIEHIIANHKNLVDDVNKTVIHMKTALEFLGQLLKKEYSIILLIKKNPGNEKMILEFFQMIVTKEENLTKIFGQGLEGKEYKEIEAIAHAALTGEKIPVKARKKEKAETQIDESTPKQRKNRLDKIAEYFSQMIASYGESADFEIFYTEINVNTPLSMKPAYGIFIKLKGKNSNYLIMQLNRQDVDRRVKNEDIPKEYRIPSFEDNLKQGIRVLKKI